MRAHPRFAAAIRTFAGGMLAIYRGNRVLNMVINDRGRMLIAYLALYLHDQSAPDGRGSGFSIGHLKAVAAASGIASPGRTSAMLAVMRMAGYIASASAPDDRRRHILVPTERLRLAHRERWERVAATLREVIPEAAAAFALHDPEFEAAYVRHTTDYFLAGFRIVDLAPKLHLFADRNAGMMILFSMILAGEPDDAILPTRPLPISISALAHRFGVSRVHVRTLLRDAEAAGLIERTGERGSHIVIRSRLAEAAETFFASAFLFTAHCGLRASEETRTSRTGGRFLQSAG
jgi:DNA-binding MarR family transcriptional regulator